MQLSLESMAPSEADFVPHKGKAGWVVTGPMQWDRHYAASAKGWVWQEAVNLRYMQKCNQKYKNVCRVVICHNTRTSQNLFWRNQICRCFYEQCGKVYQLECMSAMQTFWLFKRNVCHKLINSPYSQALNGIHHLLLRAQG